MTSRVTTPDILGNMLTGKAEPELVHLNSIKTNGSTQMRAGLNADTVAEYREAMQESGWGDFPPIVTFYDGSIHWLADGFHRLAAWQSVGVSVSDSKVPAIVKTGGQRDAILYAASANAVHGLRRTNADKRRAVEVLLRDEEWRQWSDQEIARRCAVDPKTVGTIRREMYPPTLEIPESTMRTGADGRTINTANIGANRPARLSDGDLTTIVQTWMAGFWRRPWPENPSHTNGTFWQEITAWMRENVPQPWQESDLKAAIKRLHYAHVQQWKTPAANQPAPPANDFASVLVLEGIVRSVWDALNPTIDAVTDKKLAQTARMDAINKAGQFWNQCKAAMGDDIRAYRHADLQQAIENVCSEKERTVRQAQPWAPPGIGARMPVTPTPTTQPAARPASARMSVPEIEAIVRSAASFATAADLRAEAKAMRGAAWRSILNQAGNVLYQDVAAAMNAVADQLEPVQTDALEQQNPADFGITFPDPTANLAAAEEAAAAKLRQMQIEGVRDDLNTALEALTRFGDLTGKHTETLLAGRELRRLLAMLDAERLVNVQLPQAA